MSEIRLPRRRRSVSRSPVVIDPADIPEDAAGRVEVIAVRAPADVIDPGDQQIPVAPPKPSPVVAAVVAYRGWVAVAALIVLLAAVFVLGMVLTR